MNLRAAGGADSIVCSVNAGAAGKTIDRLEELGYVHRSGDDTDPAKVTVTCRSPTPFRASALQSRGPQRDTARPIQETTEDVKGYAPVLRARFSVVSV